MTLVQRLRPYTMRRIVVWTETRNGMFVRVRRVDRRRFHPHAVAWAEGLRRG